VKAREQAREQARKKLAWESEGLNRVEEKDFDVIVIGGGHNGLVAAGYLAQSGLKVHLIEANSTLGGASSSQRIFPGVDAKLSRYSYLVSLLPDQILRDLNLDFQVIKRKVSSYTPTKIGGTSSDTGLLITPDDDGANRRSFQDIEASDDFENWQKFYQKILQAAPAIAETFLQPLPTLDELKEKIPEDVYQMLFEIPLGESLEKYFTNDLLRGVVLTDGLIGTFTDAFDPSLAANKCFLYHLVGNGTGEWNVPKGGMGALVDALTHRLRELGVTFQLGARVNEISTGKVFVEGSILTTRFIVVATSPKQMAQLQGKKAPQHLPGSQIKMNMVLKKLPELKSEIPAEIAFAGTFHIDEGFDQLQRAYQQAAAGFLPDQIPAEIYCHTLTDSSILAPDLVAQGYHTLTLFAIHTPYQLFLRGDESVKESAKDRLISQLNSYLKKPIWEVLARDSNGDYCLEIKTPLDLEQELNLPEGNIFHGDLEFPIRKSGELLKWGSESDDPTIFLGGAGARRGGGVSGIAGHNAAMAILEILNAEK